MRALIVSGSCMLLLMICFSGINPDTNTEFIYWSEDRKLTWEDFQGVPDYKYEDIGALTYSGIVHSKTCSDGIIDFEVRAYFEKHNSWVKEIARTDHHLKHEQIHFDITELYARMLNAELKERQFACDQDAEFESFIASFLHHWESKQINYDLYTQYSMRRDKQKEWEYWIAMELSLHEPCSYEE
ncbi:MAG: hypothetical protein AAF502_08005 [Bacteroidota bacterium]